MVWAEGPWTLEDPVKKLPAQVQSIEICGKWESDRYVGGVYRLVRGSLWGHDEIYVQWIGYPKELKDYYPGEEVVVATLSLPEFDEYESAADIGSVNCAVVSGKTVVKFTYTDSGEEDGAAHEMTLTLGAPGKFEQKDRVLPKKAGKQP